MKLNGFFKKLSLRTKLIIFLSTVIVITGVFNFYLYFQTNTAFNQYNQLIKDYLQVNNLSLRLNQARQNLAKYIETKDQVWKELCKKDQQEITNLADRVFAESASLETYLWGRAIISTVASYNTEIKYLLADPVTSEFYTSYAKVRKIFDYLENYTQQLLNVKLTESGWYHRRITRHVNFVRLVNLFSVIGLVIFGLFYTILLSRSITEPIQKLTKFSTNIAKGNFDNKQLEIDSSEDINILAVAFNKMAQSIQSMITELTEKANLARKLHEEELKNLRMSEQLNEAKYQALQAQINPHFLFNTLNTIMRMAMFEKANRTIQLIQSLASIFRYNLGSSQREVLLTEELLVIKEYMAIQQARFGERISYEIDSQAELSSLSVPRFIIQPLVENAIIHGLEPKESGGTVRIKFYLKESYFIIKVIDNGLGISKEKLQEIESGIDRNSESAGHTTGIGIRNVRDRLTFFYKDKRCFRLQSRAAMGTVISIRIPRIARCNDTCINY